ncbi:hypothetical protein [PinkBerry-associated phage LS06-2018-MD08]|nr:hypothetical protein [PinkBerry-associated phage LS06-2018-MD08]
MYYNINNGILYFEVSVFKLSLLMGMFDCQRCLECIRCFYNILKIGGFL